MKELVKYIVESLIDNKENISIEQEDIDGISLIKVKVLKEDLGKVIGKQGKTAQSIRTILNAATKKNGKNYRLDISELELDSGR